MTRQNRESGFGGLDNCIRRNNLGGQRSNFGGRLSLLDSSTEVEQSSVDSDLPHHTVKFTAI